MAILGQIRSKSIFLIIVIGLALFAFVISGVFDGKGYQAQQPVGVINGEEVLIEDFRGQVDFLERNGYDILETNWVFQKAEIDILAQKNNTLAVVEVKTRSSIEFGLPQDFVKPKKIQLLVKAVHAYVTENDLDLDVRFDIIAISKKDQEFVIEHLTDAFFHF